MCFSIPIIFFNLNYDCSNFLDMRNLQEQVIKAFCCQKLFWPWINFFSVGQNNFGNKIPFQILICAKVDNEGKWVEVFWGQQIKLVQVASTSELHENQCSAGPRKSKRLTASKIKYKKFGPKFLIPLDILVAQYFKNLNFLNT